MYSKNIKMAGTSILGKEEKRERMKEMLENIALELEPLYEGKLSVQESISDKRSIYISVEKTKKRNYVFCTSTKKSEELVFAVSGVFSDNPNEVSRLGVLKENSKLHYNGSTICIIKRYLEKYISECGPIEVHSERFRYISD